MPNLLEVGDRVKFKNEYWEVVARDETKSQNSNHPKWEYILRDINTGKAKTITLDEVSEIEQIQSG